MGDFSNGTFSIAPQRCEEKTKSRAHLGFSIVPHIVETYAGDIDSILGPSKKSNQGNKQLGFHIRDLRR